MTERQALDTAVDASVLINFLATDRPGKILRSTRRRFWVVPEVVREVQAARENCQHLENLLRLGQVRVAPSSEAHADLFVTLVGAAPPDDMDDGEASTIAHAALAETQVALDERKARRICRERFPQLKIISTVGILRELRQTDIEDLHFLREVTRSALQKGRMRVLPEHADWVLDLLGAEVCATCPSLPSYVRSGLATNGPERSE